MAVIVAAVLIAALFLFLERLPEEPYGPEEPGGSGKKTRTKGMEKPHRKVSEAKPSPAGQESRSIAVIIDDIGYDLAIVEELAGIPAPIAFAVLPHTPHAVAAAERLHAAGKEILLHLPMEPHAYPGESPGKGALLTAMDREEIRRTIRGDLAAVPFVSGVNNHMGSRFMEDGARLAILMEELRAENLFFVDSMTTADSRGRAQANRTGVRFAARDRFIDHTPGYDAALKTLKEAAGEDRRNNMPLLMIGHPHGQTVRALRDALPLWQARGVTMIPLSAFLRLPRAMEREAGSGLPAGGAGR